MRREVGAGEALQLSGHLHQNWLVWYQGEELTQGKSLQSEETTSEASAPAGLEAMRILTRR